ncbi:DUF4270 family protein [Kaistella polysaccharea]|uniref:DUF4270 family protein n=1 Tax=Kaistella polysaccharea TaxID=2878534 RepID=UPI001CF37D41|nr:DUF4270 family protein [Kaistella polysaccharea]
MIRNIQKIFRAASVLALGSVILWSCEPDADQLGSQFFQNGAQATETAYPLIAYTVDNHDTIRTDAARLLSATLGAFNEPQFGLQKSDYITQLRLSSPNPDFGANAILDSAVLVLKPTYAIDSVTTTTVEDYIFPDGAVPAKKVVNNYPITKYGKTKIGGNTLFNIKVEEVTEFLFSSTDQIRSNKTVSTGALLGQKVFDGTIRSIKVTKDTDNSLLYERTPAIRIDLDSTFFQNKIIAKGKSPELADVATFIRYIKGIKVSVAENDGYIFNFDPNAVEINLYYKTDKVDGTTTTRAQGVYVLNGGAGNTHFNHIAINRAGTPSAAVLLVSDTITGAPKVYAQGMGGPGIGLKIPEATIATVRSMYETDKIGIISAKMRIYTDVDLWNNNYKKPASFVVKQKVNKVDLNTFLEDMSALYTTGIYSLVKAYDLEKNPAYYDIGITQTFKSIIEKGAPINGHFILNVGTYTTDSGGNLVGASNASQGPQNFTTRSFTPNRAVFVGTDPGNDKSAKLILTYGKK